jgi:hypothetical protein
MSREWKPGCDKAAVVAAASLCIVLTGSAVHAQDAAASAKPTVLRTKPASPNATVNLVNLLVKQGVLTEEQAAGLIKQAEEEAYVARQALKDTAAKADTADKNATAATSAASPPGTKRVTYVPEIVKREIREELRKEVVGQAKAEKWAAPNTFPDWVSRIRFSGDLRMRYEGQFFPPGNDNASGSVANFNAINTGNPVDINPATSANAHGSQIILPPRDVDQNRNRYLVQARLGVEADLYDGFTAGLRVATGDSSVPISTQSMLGGGGGNFSKYPIWLDRGFLRYSPGDSLAVTVGRFDNPFFSPTDLVWYSQLAFDGIALQAKYEVTPGVTPFFVAGAFPLYDSLVNFPANGTLGTGNPATPAANFPSQDKYLFAVQGGLGWKISDDTTVRFGAAYYDFDNVQGKLSNTSCDATLVANVCNTDLLRPMFAQYGNTYMTLRNASNVSVLGTVQPQFQYFGLASAFRVIDFTGRIDFATFNPVHVMLDGTYVKNVAFNRDSIAQVAVNNLGPVSSGSTFAGGNVGAMGRLTVGYPEIKNLWDWNVYGAYKYLQSDAVMDAFTDPDFGLGGTNLKGYIVGARLGLGQNLWTSVKWMSASSIAGAPFAVDVLQVDLNGRF